MDVFFTSNIDLAIQGLDVKAKQVRYAAAVALTWSVGDAHKAMPSRLESVLDRPTAWTKNGLFVKRAEPSNLTARLAWKPSQAEYMKYQIEGGTRTPKRLALKLPAAVQLDGSGNIPRALLRQLIARAKSNKRATGSMARRYGVSSKLDLFYGDPADGRPAGLYKRVVNGTRQSLVPIVLFPKRAAVYQRRFDFYGEARRVVRASWQRNFSKAWAQAKATAR